MTTIATRETQFLGGNSDHDGIGQSSSYDFFYDKSLEAAANKATADYAIDGDEMDNVIDSTFDADQVTSREARAFVMWGEANYNSMTPEAQKKFELIRAALETAAGGDLTDGSHVHFKGNNETLNLDKAGIDALKVKLGMTDTTKGAEKAPPADGMEVCGNNNAPPTHKNPATPAAPEHDNYVSAASQMDIPDFSHMDFDEILAFFRRLIGAKELDAKHALGKLADKLKKAQTNQGDTPETRDKSAADISSIQQDMQDLQSYMKKIDEMTNMILNMEKARHDTAKAIIQNIAA